MVGTMHVTITNRAVLEHALVVGGKVRGGFFSHPTSTCPGWPSTRPRPPACIASPAALDSRTS
jgi:hypothetical protein